MKIAGKRLKKNSAHMVQRKTDLCKNPALSLQFQRARNVLYYVISKDSRKVLGRQFCAKTVQFRAIRIRKERVFHEHDTNIKKQGCF